MQILSLVVQSLIYAIIAVLGVAVFGTIYSELIPFDQLGKLVTEPVEYLEPFLYSIFPLLLVTLPGWLFFAMPIVVYTRWEKKRRFLVTCAFTVGYPIAAVVVAALLGSWAELFKFVQLQLMVGALTAVLHAFMVYPRSISR